MNDELLNTDEDELKDEQINRLARLFECLIIADKEQKKRKRNGCN